MAKANDKGTGGAVKGAPNAVARSVEGIRRMILSRELLPGEQIRQSEMAERLAVSRIPLREGLKVLETEGMLMHSPNQGFFVAKLKTRELGQIYLMRKLLETELLRSAAWPDDDLLAHIRTINESLEKAIDTGDLERIVALNREFHFAIFDLSPLDLIQREVGRLWALSDPYRALYLYDPASRDRILNEHDRVIEALATQDRRSLVTISNRHRGALEVHLARVLGPGDG